MTWTRFWDMHSGGGLKEKPFDEIYIEAPKQEAKAIFYNRFGHSPDRVTCSCCGTDYNTWEFSSLEEASEFFRDDGSLDVSRYVQLESVLVIPSSQIKDDERVDVVITEVWSRSKWK